MRRVNTRRGTQPWVYHVRSATARPPDAMRPAAVAMQGAKKTATRAIESLSCPVPKCRSGGAQSRARRELRVQPGQRRGSAPLAGASLESTTSSSSSAAAATAAGNSSGQKRRPRKWPRRSQPGGAHGAQQSAPGDNEVSSGAAASTSNNSSGSSSSSSTARPPGVGVSSSVVVPKSRRCGSAKSRP